MPVLDQEADLAARGAKLMSYRLWMTTGIVQPN